MRRSIGKWVVGLALAVGCAAAFYDPYYYGATYYDPYYYGYDAAYAYSWVDPYGYVYFAAPSGTTAIDLNAAASSVASAANSTYYTPAGCANATANGAVVNYNFVNCNGPGGLINLNGKVTTTLSQNADGALVGTTTSDGLTINGAAFIVDTVTTATQSGDQRTATVVSHSREPDRFQARDGNYTVTWTRGSNCFEVNGTSNTTSPTGLTETTTVNGLQRCTGECTKAGSVTVVGGGKNFTATFNGSPTVVVTAPDGSTQTFEQQCQ